MRVLFACVLMLGAAATPKDPDGDELRAMEAKIDKRIGAARCEENAECRAAPFGAKPCGGPWSYKAYSTRNTDVAALLREIETYRSRNAELNRKNRLGSDCRLVEAPAVRCQEGRCSTGVPVAPE